jgi:hypothetical protein
VGRGVSDRSDVVLLLTCPDAVRSVNGRPLFPGRDYHHRRLTGSSLTVKTCGSSVSDSVITELSLILDVLGTPMVWTTISVYEDFSAARTDVVFPSLTDGRLPGDHFFPIKVSLGRRAHTSR